MPILWTLTTRLPWPITTADGVKVAAGATIVPGAHMDRDVASLGHSGGYDVLGEENGGFSMTKHESIR